MEGLTVPGTAACSANPEEGKRGGRAEVRVPDTAHAIDDLGRVTERRSPLHPSLQSQGPFWEQAEPGLPWKTHIPVLRNGSVLADF